MNKKKNYYGLFSYNYYCHKLVLVINITIIVIIFTLSLPFVARAMNSKVLHSLSRRVTISTTSTSTRGSTTRTSVLTNSVPTTITNSNSNSNSNGPQLKNKFDKIYYHTNNNNQSGVSNSIVDDNLIAGYKSLDWQKHSNNYVPLSHFHVVSFNLLAPCYKRLSFRTPSGHRMRESQFVDVWKERARRTIDFFEKEIFNKKEIIALQEYWLDEQYTQLFEELLNQNNYEIQYLQRSGGKDDAVAIITKKDIFTVLGFEHLYLGTIGNRVALLLWVQHKTTKKDIIIANTHLSFPHNFFDRQNQLVQVKLITKTIEGFAARHNILEATRIITGDFNAVTNSPTCDHLREVGYSSCFEIRPPINSDCINVLDDHDNNCSDDDIKSSRGSNSDSNSSDSSDSSNSSNSSNNDSNIAIDEIRKKLILNSASYDYETTIPSYGKDTEFVSHRTHNKDDLGVDHIFIKPGLDENYHFANYLGKNQMVSTTNCGSSGVDIHDSKNENSALLDKENSSEDIDTQGHEVSYSSYNRYSSNNTYAIFVDDTIVLPAELSCRTWDENFEISDHRPVSTKIIFGRKIVKNGENEDISQE